MYLACVVSVSCTFVMGRELEEDNTRFVREKNVKRPMGRLVGCDIPGSMVVGGRRAVPKGPRQ